MQKDQHSGYINARMISDVVHMGPNKGSKTSTWPCDCLTSYSYRGMKANTLLPGSVMSLNMMVRLCIDLWRYKVQSVW